MNYFASHAEILTALEAQLPAKLAGIACEIMPTSDFGFLYNVARFPLVGIVAGGYRSDGKNDPLVDYTVDFAVFVEVPKGRNPKDIVLGAAGLKGILELAGDTLEALDELKDLGIEMTNYGRGLVVPRIDGAELLDGKKLLRQWVSYWYRKNE